MDIRNLDTKYKIRDDEHDDDYELRICGYHDTDNLTWEDIAFVIKDQTGNDKSESTYRKNYKLYLKGMRDSVSSRPASPKKESSAELSIDFDAVGDIELTDDMKAMIISARESDKMKQRERYMRGALTMAENREIRHDSRFSLFYNTIAEQIKPLDPPDMIRELDIENSSASEYVMTLADLHIGANFRSVHNEYSLDTVKYRFEKLLNYIKNFVLEKNINKLTILSLGDIVQGMLRISDTMINETTVVEAFVFAMRIISDFLNKLSKYCLIDFIQVCYSNHDQLRFLGSKASEFAGEDLGKIMFAYLTDTLINNDRVTIIGDPETNYFEFNIFDYTCIAMHGHQINNLDKVAQELLNNRRKLYDYIFLGHTHRSQELPFGEGDRHDTEVLVAPSFVGSDPYADKLMKGSKAAVKIFEFTEDCGHCASYKFILN